MCFILGHLFSAPPHLPLGPFSYSPSSMLHHHHHPGSAAAALAAVAALGASFPTSFSAPPPPHLVYWPYPSPPISPNNYYNTMAPNGGPPHLQGLPPMSNGHQNMLTPPNQSSSLPPSMVRKNVDFAIKHFDLVNQGILKGEVSLYR